MNNPVSFADAHNDLLQRALAGDAIHSRLPDGHSDFVRIREAGVVLQILSVWVPVRYEQEGKSPDQAHRLIDAFEKSISQAAGIAATHSSPGKTTYLLGMEGSHPLASDPRQVEVFRRRGIRYLSPTWNNSVSWATSARDEHSPGFSGPKGLNGAGREMIAEFNRVGIVPDVSHVGERTFWDMIDVSKGPLMASHSACMALCSHPRNLTDEQIKAIAMTGGVVCMNFFSGFLDPSYFTRRNERLTSIRAERKGPVESDFPNYEAFFTHEDRWIGREVADLRPSIDLLTDHILHALRIAGEDHVALGSDFDGIETAPAGMESVLDLQKIPGLLKERGLSDLTISKICSENLIRLFTD